MGPVYVVDLDAFDSRSSSSATLVSRGQAVLSNRKRPGDQQRPGEGGADGADQAEISVMRLLRHPNVVELKEVMATKSKVFVVMEYVCGGDLFAKVAQGKLKEDAARQLISAVDYCNNCGVSHRDLKLENLLLDKNEDLKISDFGLSALLEQLCQDGLLHTQCGMPAYVAPEVLRKKGYDGATADVWSYGVILYVLLVGFLPFQDENIMKMYRKVFKVEYSFPRWFSPGARNLISKLLVADPQKWITVSDIIKVSWFKKGSPSPCLQDNDHLIKSANSSEGEEEEGDNNMNSKSVVHSSPPFFNAFELISSMSSGFDLSSLFETKKKAGSMFTSTCSASAIMAKLEGVAKGLRFRVVDPVRRRSWPLLFLFFFR